MIHEIRHSVLSELQEGYFNPYYGLKIVKRELRDYMDSVLELHECNYRKTLYLNYGLTPKREVIQAIHSVAHILLEHSGTPDEIGNRLIIELKEFDQEVNAEFRHYPNNELEHSQASILTDGLMRRNFQRNWKNIYSGILENSQSIPNDYEYLHESVLSFNQFLIDKGIVI